MEDQQSKDNYKGLARFALFALTAEVLLGTKLPTGLHLFLAWGLSGLILLGALRGTEDDDDGKERSQRRNWGMVLLFVPLLLLALAYASQSEWLASAAGGAVATPGLFGIVLLAFARPFATDPHLTAMSLRKPEPITDSGLPANQKLGFQSFEAPEQSDS